MPLKANALSAHDTFNALLDAYESLLTSHQAQWMDMYYRYNLSLQEIAQKDDVSRAAVSDTLTKARQHLFRLEKHLRLVAIQQTLTGWLDDPSVPLPLKKQIKRLLKRE
jgi:predicted DNA-binding protein YlxM (UPF0122 family)